MIWFARWHRPQFPESVAEAEEAFAGAEKISKLAQSLEDKAETTFEGTSVVASAVQKGASFVTKAAEKRREEAFKVLLGAKVEAVITASDEFLHAFSRMGRARAAHMILRAEGIDNVIRTVPDPDGEGSSYQIFIAGEDRKRISETAMEKIRDLSRGAAVVGGSEAR